MSAFIFNTQVQNASTGTSAVSNPNWTSLEEALVDTVLTGVTSTPQTVSPETIITPKLFQFKLVSGDPIEISIDNGSTYPLGALNVGDIAPVPINIYPLREISSIQVGADVAGSLDGTYFLIYDRNGSVGVWIAIDDGATAIPGGAAAADRAIRIGTILTDATAIAVAAALASALEADDEFLAVSDGVDTVTATDQHLGNRTNTADGTTGWTFSTTQSGTTAPVVKLRSTGISSVQKTILPN